MMMGMMIIIAIINSFCSFICIACFHCTFDCHSVYLESYVLHLKDEELCTLFTFDGYLSSSHQN
uniref:Secreted protein n=1 Tax=Octopus bimaculoides TaxID=37653 RepID=A0A0L8G190_OCTBM